MVLTPRRIEWSTVRILCTSVYLEESLCFQAARGKAEELMQHAIENELSAKSQLDMEQQRLGQVENEIDMERDKVCTAAMLMYLHWDMIAKARFTPSGCDKSCQVSSHCSVSTRIHYGVPSGIIQVWCIQ